MLIPVVQGRLEKKLTEDLERLQGRAGGLMRALLVSPCVALLAAAGGARAESRRPRTRSRTDPVYVDPQRRAGGRRSTRPRCGAQIGEREPIFIAVLPESAVEGSPGRTLIALRQDVGEEGTLRARGRRRAAHAAGRRRRGGRAAPGRPPGGADGVRRQRRGRRLRRRRRDRRRDRHRAADRRRRRRRGPARQPPPPARAATASPRPARRTSTRTSCGSATGSARSSST